MAHGTRVPNIQPLPQANTMEQMSTASDPRLTGSQFTEANGARVPTPPLKVLAPPRPQQVERPLTEHGHALQLAARAPPLRVRAPALARLHKDVEVGVDADHERSERAARLEEQDVEAVEEEEHGHCELGDVAEAFHAIDVVVQVVGGFVGVTFVQDLVITKVRRRK